MISSNFLHRKILHACLCLCLCAWFVIAETGFAQAPEGDAAGELPVLLRSLATVKAPAPPFENGVFVPRDDETIAFLGGTNTFDQQRYPSLETRFYLAWPERRLHFRNLAWQGDTLYHQARPRFFYTVKGDPLPGSSPDSRERTEPGIIFVCFGKVESLDGMQRFPEFLATYASFLDQLQARTGRIVVVLPTPFFAVGPTANLAKDRNTTLGKFAAGIRELATQRGLITVDTFSPLLKSLDPALSSNGIHLTEAGQAEVARLVADQLNVPAVARNASGAGGIAQSLNQSIQRKNRLWQQYYHPTNWAFLFGDRQHVPASRNHIDTNKRWMVDELDALPPLISETEADIYRYAAQ